MRPVEIAGRGQQKLSLLAARLVCAVLEPVAHARRELGGGLLGEGDHDQLIDLDGPRGEQVHHSVHEHRGLPGAGRGLDAQVLVQRGRDPVAGLLVNQLAGAHSTVRISVVSRARRSSVALRFM